MPGKLKTTVMSMELMKSLNFFKLETNGEKTENEPDEETLHGLSLVNVM